MKNITFILVINLLLFFTSCGKEQELVEIYLPKHRIEANYGIELSKMNSIDTNRVKSTSPIFEKNTKYLKFDTIKKDFIYSGTFNINKEDINEKPLVYHDEILDFDTINCTLKLKKSAIEKIRKLQPFNEKGFGQQFILCINKKPVLQGYFVSFYHKFPIENNYILFINSEKNNEIELFNSNHECIDKKIKLQLKKHIKKTVANNGLAQ